LPLQLRNRLIAQIDFIVYVSASAPPPRRKPGRDRRGLVPRTSAGAPERSGKRSSPGSPQRTKGELDTSGTSASLSSERSVSWGSTPPPPQKSEFWKLFRTPCRVEVVHPDSKRNAGSSADKHHPRFPYLERPWTTESPFPNPRDRGNPVFHALHAPDIPCCPCLARRRDHGNPISHASHAPGPRKPCFLCPARDHGNH
jgi:hypothetical protein